MKESSSNYTSGKESTFRKRRRAFVSCQRQASLSFLVCFSDRQDDSSLVEVKITALKEIHSNTVFYFSLDSFPVVLNLFRARYCFLLQFPL